MTIKQQIETYLASLPHAKSNDMLVLHHLIQELNLDGKLWFLDGKDESGKVVSNPNIGYGEYTIHYANGTSKSFYQVGLSANTTGISIYIMGLTDKNYLKQNFSEKLGKASITSYCIKFKRLSDLHFDILKSVIDLGLSQS